MRRMEQALLSGDPQGDTSMVPRQRVSFSVGGLVAVLLALALWAVPLLRPSPPVDVPATGGGAVTTQPGG